VASVKDRMSQNRKIQLTVLPCLLRKSTSGSCCGQNIRNDAQLCILMCDEANALPLCLPRSNPLRMISVPALPNPTCINEPIRSIVLMRKEVSILNGHWHVRIVNEIVLHVMKCNHSSPLSALHFPS
jgi:hypothetical protein